jgi:hypothetical protein
LDLGEYLLIFNGQSQPDVRSVVGSWKMGTRLEIDGGDYSIGFRATGMFTPVFRAFPIPVFTMTVHVNASAERTRLRYIPSGVED